MLPVLYYVTRHTNGFSLKAILTVFNLVNIRFAHRQSAVSMRLFTFLLSTTLVTRKFENKDAQTDQRQ